MTDGDRSSGWINFFGIVRNAQFPQYRQALRSKRFIQLDDIHL
jgi:hypothetical protein